MSRLGSVCGLLYDCTLNGGLSQVEDFVILRSPWVDQFNIVSRPFASPIVYIGFYFNVGGLAAQNPTDFYYSS